MQARPAPPSRQRGGFLASEPLLLVGLVILTLYFARDLLAPMAFALVLNFLLSPAVERLERWRLSRAPARDKWTCGEATAGRQCRQQFCRKM